MNLLKFIAPIILAFPMMSFGATEAPSGGMTIRYMGVQQNGNLGFFDTTEAPANAPSRNCPNGLYYLDLSTTAGRAIYATLLTTKVAGRKLFRVDWALSGNCMATIVVPQD